MGSAKVAIQSSGSRFDVTIIEPTRCLSTTISYASPALGDVHRLEAEVADDQQVDGDDPGLLPLVAVVEPRA